MNSGGGSFGFNTKVVNSVPEIISVPEITLVPEIILERVIFCKSGPPPGQFTLISRKWYI